MGLSRKDVYIANVLKCRPPGNRNPEPAEIASCRPYLDAQIDLVKPAVLVALGKFAAQFLLETEEPISAAAREVGKPERDPRDADVPPVLPPPPAGEEEGGLGRPPAGAQEDGPPDPREEGRAGPVSGRRFLGPLLVAAFAAFGVALVVFVARRLSRRRRSQAIGPAADASRRPDGRPSRRRRCRPRSSPGCGPPPTRTRATRKAARSSGSCTATTDPYFVRGDFDARRAARLRPGASSAATGRSRLFDVAVFFGAPEGFSPPVWVDRGLLLSGGDLSVDRSVLVVTEDVEQEVSRRWRWDPADGPLRRRRRRDSGRTTASPGPSRTAGSERRPDTVTPDETARRVAVLLPTGFPQLATYLLAPEMPRPAAGHPRRRAVRDPPPDRARRARSRLRRSPAGTTEREVLSLLDETPFLPEAFVDLLLRAAAYYFAPPGELLRAAVPGRLLDLGQASYVPTSRAVGADGCRRAAPAEVLAALLEAGRATPLELADSGSGAAASAKALRALLDEGFVRIPSEEMRAARPPLTKSWVARGAADDPRLARRPKQRNALAHLAALGRPASAGELRAAGATPAVLAALAKDGLVAVVEEERPPTPPSTRSRRARPSPIVPTAAQREAVEAIGRGARPGRRGPVPPRRRDGEREDGGLPRRAGARRSRSGGRGSSSCRRSRSCRGSSAASSPASANRVSLLHSGLSDGERSAAWERARRGEVDAVVGPRSAVFAPLPRLGLIVVDEAHDGSYKQAEAPRYDARTVARVRAHGEGAVLLLGSATPSMEQEQAARDGGLTRLVLPARPGRPRPGRGRGRRPSRRAGAPRRPRPGPLRLAHGRAPARRPSTGESRRSSS